MNEKFKLIDTVEELEDAITFSPECYISEDYAREEKDKLWRKVWLQAGRLEDIPDVGDYITYEILDDSILIIRSTADEITAYHNVCPHRGRRLIDTPPGARNARGNAQRFVCGFHGWTFNTEGKNVHTPEKADWNGALEGGCNDLATVRVDTRSGWIFINMNDECESLTDYLEPAASMLAPFQLQNMRVRWRKWGVFDCNWKVAMEAFCETYHVQATHPEFNKFGSFRGWGRSQGKHSHIGYDAPKGMNQNQSAKLRLGTEGDPRISTAEREVFTWEKANTNTTRTLVDAALRLKDELPEGTPSGDVLAHWLESAKTTDEARGVVWPIIDPEHVGASGTAWQLFPNFQIGHAVNNMLTYQARPYGNNPDKCIFEAAVYELYPDGEEPKPEWQYSPATEEAWCYVLAQDFDNMAAVQQGMKSAGFSGPKPNPYMERAVANFHYNLSRYLGDETLCKLK